MTRTYRQITFERRGDACCARLRSFRLEEAAIHQLVEELLALVQQEGCHNLALSFGAGAPQCLYSVFLAKMVTLQRLLRQQGGDLILCEVTPEVRSVFEACRLDQQFRFVKDFDEAIASWTA